MSKKVTIHQTGKASVKFMAAARALKNIKNGKEEFSVKLELLNSQENTQALRDHLMEVAEYKVDTKTNRKLDDRMVVNFSSTYAPKVYDAQGTELTGQDIPFFDGRIDTGTVDVTYKVIDYGTNKIVRLAGIKILDLNLAPRDTNEASIDDIKSQLNNI